MALAFRRASRAQAKLRLALIGPSGSGKTYTALRFAKGLGQRIALIDTERGSASKYADDVAEFDTIELDTFSPRTYVEAIQLAEREGYDVIVIDSLSHAWSGKGGALEMVDRAAKRSQSGNSFAAWRDVTPEHNALVDAIVGARCHVIATMRAKTEYVLEEDARGKKMPRKIGLAPVQRDGMEYEFDVVADLSLEHDMMVSKTRCAVLDKAVIREPGEDVAKILRDWLSTGAPPAPPPPSPVELLIGELDAAESFDALKPLRARAVSLKPSMTVPERERVSAAIAEAQRRIAEAAEAAAAAAATENSESKEGENAA